MTRNYGLVLCLWAQVTWGLAVKPNFEFDHAHQKWNLVLENYVDTSNLVDYESLTRDSRLLDSYLGQVTEVRFHDYANWTANEQKAFLINAYNGFTLKLIAEHYPVKSIRNIGGVLDSPWKKNFFAILDGKITNLDGIEHDTLRRNFSDYRIHAALNCASISCPVLRREAYVAHDLDLQLDAQMHTWLLDSERNSFDLQDNRIRLSRIFKWYRKDFERWGESVEAVLLKHGTPVVKQLLDRDAKISYLPYNWNLNASSN